MKQGNAHNNDFFLQSFLITGSIILSSLSAINPAFSQIASDGTLSTNVTTGDNLNFTINGGNRAGNNLFHSFREFSIPTGGEAFFNNAADIQNIFSRVTGSSISNIDGLIRANGGANLFLLNPNGIIFGPNARLNIGGSFLASTARSVTFADGTFFSTTPSQTTPLLTVSVPIGLQFGSTAGSIINQSRTSEGDRVVGLKVTPGNTLALVGGDVALEGSTLSALRGRVELGSVAGNSLVSLTPTAQGFALGYEGVQNFQDVQLSQVANVIGGDVQVQGKRLTLTDGSQIFAVTLELEPAQLLVNTSESVELSGISPDGNSNSSLAGGAAGAGDAGNVTITTGRLIVRDGGVVVTIANEEGKAGAITVNARESVDLSGTSPTGGFTGLLASTFGTGDAGNITISTGRLTVRNGASVSTLTDSAGKGGTINAIASESVEVSGTSSNGLPSSLLAGTSSTGDAGNVFIHTTRLIVRDGAQVLASSSSQLKGGGDAGQVNAIASESVELSGVLPNGMAPTALSASTLGTGDAGNVTIQTDRLTVSDGAMIATSTLSTGKAGNVNVTASKLVELIGTSPNEQFPTPSGLAAETFSTGAGGTVNIDTQRLIVRDGAMIAVSALSKGDAGTVNVNASEAVELSGTSRLVFRGLPSNLLPVFGSITLPNKQSPSLIGAATFGVGNAGDVTIKTGQLSIRDGAAVVAGTSVATGRLRLGSGGNLTIKASSVELSGISSDGQSTSKLTAEADGAGNAGNIAIETDRLVVRDRAQISVSGTGTGNPGSIAIAAPTLNLDNQGKLSATSETGSGGNIELQARNIQLRHQSEISAASAPGTAQGNIGISTQTLVLLEGSQIRTDAAAPNGGSNIRISPFGNSNLAIFQSPDSIINASGQLTIEGDIQPEPPNIPQVVVVDTTGLIEQRCSSARQGSSFTVTGRGGIPPSPSEPLNVESYLVNLVTLNTESQGRRGAGGQVSKESNSPVTEIVEATGWIVNEKGQVVLTASAPVVTPYLPGLGSVNCRDR